MPPTLTLRPCVIGGQTAPNDYQVFSDGCAIGRILEAVTGDAPAWLWSCYLPGRPQSDNERGRAENFEDAKAEFRQAWERVAAETVKVTP